MKIFNARILATVIDARCNHLEIQFTLEVSSESGCGNKRVNIFDSFVEDFFKIFPKERFIDLAGSIIRVKMDTNFKIVEIGHPMQDLWLTLS